MKALSVVFMLFLSLVTFSSRDLIEDICRSSSDFKSLTKAKSIYNEIVSLLKQEKEPVLKQSLQVCKENYDNVIDDAISSIKYFYANDFNGAKSLASGVASGPETCEESYSEPPIRTPIKLKDLLILPMRLDMTVRCELVGLRFGWVKAAYVWKILCGYVELDCSNYDRLLMVSRGYEFIVYRIIGVTRDFFEFWHELSVILRKGWTYLPDYKTLQQGNEIITLPQSLKKTPDPQYRNWACNLGYKRLKTLSPRSEKCVIAKKIQNKPKLPK
ncbi:hypothetical protein H5410_053098 [Solanum commersonii]|uniref:Pectinesterase inhibitor domain-containing protein n=1 Tax=Solanum commersonii TaxID=4109 RepID=A0A9J5X3Z9_SOLCO|nr:hypothetical protein H5410_053098 [Solanum commersonii]